MPLPAEAHRFLYENTYAAVLYQEAVHTLDNRLQYKPYFPYKELSLADSWKSLVYLKNTTECLLGPAPTKNHLPTPDAEKSEAVLPWFQSSVCLHLSHQTAATALSFLLPDTTSQNSSNAQSHSSIVLRRFSPSLPVENSDTWADFICSYTLFKKRHQL